MIQDLPISSVTIRLYLDVNNNDSLDVADVLVATTLTDGDSGNYCFEDVTPGEYVVSEVQPSNYLSVSDHDESTGAFDPDGGAQAGDPDNEIQVTLVPAEQDNDNNFVEDPIVGSITGNVTNDIGAPISNITISLYNDTNADGNKDGLPIATAITNASGNYIFTGVEPGYYVVFETQPLYYNSISDYDHTTASPDTDGNDIAQGPDNDIPVKVLPAEVDADNDFVDGRPGNICGNVSDDTGLPISSVVLNLYLDVNNNDSLDAADIFVASILTDGDTGDYCFEDVTPGEYIVSEIQPANYNSLSDYDHSTGASDPDGVAQAGDPDNEIQVTVVPAEFDNDNDFVEDPFVGSITGFVNDEIGAPMSGVTVKLYYDTNADGNEDGVAISTTTTNGSGAYAFTGVEPGLYVVVETQPANYNSISDYDHSISASDLDGNDSAQGPDDDIPVKVLPGEADADNDFVDGRPGQICGYVHDDTGLFIANVEMRLYKDTNNNDSFDVADVLALTVFTDASGNYCFTNVAPGEYVIVEIQPAFYNSVSDYDHTTGVSDPDGVAQAGDPDNEIQVTLVPAENDNDNDYIEDPFTGIVTGHVYDDAGTPIANVQVSLFNDSNADGVQDGTAIATMLTNGSGVYTFTGIEPGLYVVVETQPFYYSSISDYDTTTAPPDTDGNDSAQGPDDNIPVLLTPGETDADNNFVDGRPGTICGSVHDNLGQPISSVQIKLYLDVNNNDAFDAGDVLVALMYTDGDTGGYCFEDQTPGEYVVVETDPNNYYSVSDYDTSTPASDPDGNDQADGPDNQIPVTLVPAENDNDNNFIDAPFPGTITGYIVDDAGTPLNNVKVRLYHDTNFDGNEDGSPIDSAYTNASGFYSIGNVLPGFYVVVEINPFYYSDISDYDTSTTGGDNDGNDSAQGPDNDIPVTITPGEVDADNDFTDGRPGTICGSVTNDLSAPISNVNVQLFIDVNGNGNIDPGDNMVGSVLTDGDTGNYCFEDVTPGVYVIKEIQLPNYGDLSDWDMTPDPDGDDSAQGPDNNIPVVLTPNEADNDNNFVDIVCPGPPTITGFAHDTICSGQSLSFTAVNPGVGSVTYSWTFGSGSTPSTGVGIGPQTVSYISNATNSTTGAIVNLTETKVGCTPASGAVAHVIVNPIPTATINGATTNLCYFAPRTFTPVSAFVPGYTYTWSFGPGATPATSTTYGPHTIEYSTTGVKTVKLVVSSNAPGSSCKDSSTISFTVIQCFGNVTGKVRLADNTGIGGVNVRLYNDVNRDGLPDAGAPVKSVFTTNAGVYSMTSIIPGSYIIQEFQPDGYVSLYDQDETNDNDSTVTYSVPNDDLIPTTVEPSEIDADNVFVEAPSPGTATGYVFDDGNSDLTPEAGEGILGATIKLFTDIDTNGIADPGGFVTSTTSLSTGFYSIGNLPPGSYVLVELQPANYNNVMDIDPSSDNDKVLNFNTMNDTIPLTISNGETDADNYFVEAIACSQMVTNANDNGPGSLRYVIDCSDPGDTIHFAAGLTGQTIYLNSDRISIYKDIHIMSDLNPRVMIYSDVPGAFMVAPGDTVEIKNLNITSGLGGMSGAGFENMGVLTLWDIWLYRNPLLPPNTILIYNGPTGELNVKGTTEVHMN